MAVQEVSITFLSSPVLSQKLDAIISVMNDHRAENSFRGDLCNWVSGRVWFEISAI